MNVESKTTGKAVIRPFETSDAEAVYGVYRSLVGEERALIETDILCGDLGGALDLSFVAEVDGRVEGFIIARHTYVGEPPVESGLLYGLGVHPVYQRQGLASRLVTAVAEKAGSSGIRNLRVMLNERDSQIEGFFQRLNFHRAKLAVYDLEL